MSLVPRDALLSIEAALGKFVTVQLIQGEMVLQHHLADPTNVSHDIGYIIGDAQVLMAFPATDLMSGLGVLQRGDTVDIFATMTVEVSPTTIAPAPGTTQEQQEKITRMFTFDAFQRIQVTAIVADVVTEATRTEAGAPQPTPNPADIKVRAYLFAMDPQDALVLKNMRDKNAVFDIVLRSPTSNELFAVSPVTVEYLLHMGREAARVMVPRGHGTILFTGAPASVRGGAGFAAFAGAKHALRALAQSMARELGPLGIHVAHVVIDGAIDTPFIRDNFPERYALKDRDGLLEPEAIAENYWMLHRQACSAWTHELDLRPWIEKF